MAFSQAFIAGVDALGAGLLHFLWQGVALGLLYASLRPLCVSVGARYRLGMGMLLALALCAPLTMFYAWPGEGVGATMVSTILTSPQPASIAAVADTTAADWGLREFPAVVGGAWMCGVVGIALRRCGIGVVWRGWWPRCDTTPAVEEKLAQMSRRFGLRRPVRLLASAKVATPMLIGWIKPVILLPLSMPQRFFRPPDRTHHAHELGHVRRWDYLANLVQVVIEVVLFYHPVVHWISRDVRTCVKTAATIWY